MTRSAGALARTLIDHVRSAGVLDLDLLTSHPLEALKADPSVEVDWVAANRLPADCSIAATYDGSVSPARITVAEDASAGRRRFSLLHEYGHHLRNEVTEVLTVLFAARGRSGPLEEKMCDAFASLVLIPDRTRANAFAGGVTAAAVAKLMAASGASKQAVAVAAAESMTHPGYVMLLNADGEAEFAARSGDVFPIRRGTEQRGLLSRAAAGVAVRGVAELHRGGGVMTPELNVEAAVAPGCVVVVAVDGPASGATFSGGRYAYGSPADGWCEECSKSFTTFAAGCPTCGEPKCPDCGSCGCGLKTVVGERTCEGCWTVQPPAAFESPNADKCRDCA
jgi:hypothetical protein